MLTVSASVQMCKNEGYNVWLINGDCSSVSVMI